MTRSLPAVSAPSSAWGWPVDPLAYDRTPELRWSEGQALAAIARVRPREQWPRQARLDLQRLLIPIADALAALRVSPATRDGVVRRLLVGMHERDRAFWGWTEDAWLAFLQQSPHDRQHLLGVGYLLCGCSFPALHTRLGRIQQIAFARMVFGPAAVADASAPVMAILRQWGYGRDRITGYVPNALCESLLANRSPLLRDLTRAVLATIQQQAGTVYLRLGVVLVSRALVGLGILPAPLEPAPRPAAPVEEGRRDALTEWDAWCRRWRATSTLAARTREGTFYSLRQTGRWLAQTHPTVTSPAQWTRQLAAEYVAAVDRLAIGQWTPDFAARCPGRVGKPLMAGTKHRHLTAMRAFFRDCQEWNWIPRQFDPRRCFATPRSIRALLGPNPRVLADDVWAKLLWAGLNLTATDLPGQTERRGSWYPLAMVRALVLTWLFAGLRADEISRLRVGCIRWQRGDVTVAGTGDSLPQDAVCLLDVPAHKTGTAFTKPVDRLVGEAIRAWERVRPEQPARLDPKTGEVVAYLFAYRGMRLGPNYLNRVVIPVLCRKAGIAASDARGRITSHRARSTIASQLFNAKEPLSLFELQAWLGHRSPDSTQHYVRITPTRLAKAYADAGYFGRNVRMIEVLLDREAITSGAAAAGEPWKFYHLGHGFCTYEFFDQCPHRMACAKCAFYLPKGSSRADLLEGSAHLQRLLEEIPLSEPERAAVEEGIDAYTTLIARLADVPTPAGPTPRQLGASGLRELPVIAVEARPRVQRSGQASVPGGETGRIR